MEVSQYETNKNGKGAHALVLSEDGMHRIAFWLRILCGAGLEKKFDPVFVMENIIPLFDETFNYKIVDISQWQWTSFQPALYNPDRNEIIIRSDTYERAISGSAMDIITIAHEVTHCVQTILMRILNAMRCVDFKTEFCKTDSEEMAHHELQTDKITSLILSPKRLTEGKSNEEILKTYLIDPLLQVIFGIIKEIGKEFSKLVSDFNLIKNMEAEKCAV